MSDHNATTRPSFEQQVGVFSGPDSPFARRPESTLAWIEPLEADMVVLDVACGAAHVAETIAPHVREVVGVDLTPALLELGAARLRDAGTTNVLLQEGDVVSLPFVDGSFDVVVCRTALHHFPEKRRAVEEMARVCRPDGRVVVLDMVAPSIEVRETFDQVHRAFDPSHADVLLEKELAELVADVVGPITYGATDSLRDLPVDVMLTDASDREAAMVPIHNELAGGAPTGFAPHRNRDKILVSFTMTVVHGKRALG
jgi:ubiquinone/menaquinone biosynthesis C-methylase UbiE